MPTKKIKWRKIKAPSVWRPIPGDELIGRYVGRTTRDGQYGQYEVVAISVPYRGVYMISGTMIIQLTDSAMLTRGDAVRVVFVGEKDLRSEDDTRRRYMKKFELYVGEKS